MAGLPQDRPIPGAPLLDPLGMEPVLPMAPQDPGALPPPYAAELAGMGPEPAPEFWAPDDWFAVAGATPPSEFQNKDVPLLEPTPPAPEVDAISAAAPVVDTPAPAAPAAPANPYPEAPRRPSTGDAYLDTLNDAADVRAHAAVQQAEAEQAKNTYLSDEGVRIAKEQSARQSSADAEYQQVYNEARAQRKVLDQEAQDIANQKVDPRRAWKSMSFGQQLAVAVISGLNGMTSRTMATGQNPVLAAVEAMAEKDIAAQEADLANRWKGNTQRRGLLADEMSAGRDMLDVRYKAITAAYAMAENQMKAYALKYDNPLITARTAERLADIGEAKATKAVQYTAAKEQQLYERKQDAIKNAQTWTQINEARRARAEAARGRDIQAEKFDFERQKHADETAIMSRREPGKVIGTAKTGERALNANKIIENNGRLEALYEEGRELFKNGRERNPASARYRAQKDFDAKWVNVVKTADGDFSAPNQFDFDARGIFGGFTSMNPVAALDSSYKLAKEQGAAALRPFLDEDTLAAEGFLTPPQKDTAAGNRQGSTVTPIVYQDDDGTINTEGRGTPLSPEESAPILERQEKAKRGPDPEEWKYKRSQNNIAAKSGRALPFPDAGTGPID